MNKSKSVAVTVLFAVMLALIDMGLLKLWMPGFGIITGTLALYGFWKTAQGFSSWLCGGEALELPEPKNLEAGDERAEILEPVFECVDDV